MTTLLVGIIFVLIVLIPLTLTIWLIVYAARSATQTVGSCRRCTYNLAGLGDRRTCPECGHPFIVNAEGIPISTPHVTPS